MKKRELGSTGENVSTLCLGAMYFGTKQNEIESFSLLDQYTESGGNFIDTANIYAWWINGCKGGESESIIGKWLKSRKNRDSTFIASKVGFAYGDIPRSLSAEIIEQECNKSLKRLQVETIDLYYAHNDDRLTPLEETLEAFYQLHKSGKIRYIGASNYFSWRLEEARCISRENVWLNYCCIQQRHTFLRKKHGTNFDPQIAVNDDLLDYCKNREITLLAYSPLLGGAYTRDDRNFDEQYLGTDSDNRLMVLEWVSKELGCTKNQLILAWMLQSDPPIIPIIAASTKFQLEENIKSQRINIPQKQLSHLNSAGPI